MANKRIKISELPKVTYDPLADIYLTKSDYLPIAVTNKLDLSAKTTMAVTTRELQRFTLQQPSDLEDAANELTIGSPGVTINMGKVNVSTTLTVTGDCIFSGNVTMSSITLESGEFNSDIQVGQSVYPGRITAAGGSPIPFGLLVANSSGFIKQTGATGMSLASLVANAAVTAPANVGRVVTIDANGKLNFSIGIGSLIGGDGSLTTDPAKYHNVVTVSNKGGLSPDSGVSVSTLTNVVAATTGTFVSESDVSSSSQKFLTTTAASPSVDDIKVHNTLTLKKVNDAVNVVEATLGETIYNQNKILTTRASSPSLDDVEFAPSDSMLINTSVNSSYDAADFQDSSDAGDPRVVFKSPIVLGAKHPDNVDLTDEATDYQTTLSVKGPKNFAAQVGEIRWNFYNNVPTIYLAVKKMSGVAGAVGGACHWYGVPLFGTIDLDTGYDPTTGYLDDSALNKHSYQDLD